MRQVSDFHGIQAVHQMQGQNAAGVERSFAKLLMLGQEACRRPMPMICIPPRPETPFPYGDLVPLGFLLRALQQATECSNTEGLVNRLHNLLAEKKQDSLWAFHTGHLITSTDSSLILLGCDDLEALEALEIFHDGQYGYYPQLWSHESRPNHMLLKESYRHWCQVDYGTSCLIRGLRKANGLISNTPLSYLSEGFERRSGLFFANPYLVDWVLALAIENDLQADTLGTQLLLEVLASQRADGAFGAFDTCLSTALAVLTLAVLGYQGNAVIRAQQWLMEATNTHLSDEKARPFYSSDLLDDTKIPFQTLLQLKALNGAQLSQVGQRYHAISYYEDRENVIGSALLFLALRIGYKAFVRGLGDAERMISPQTCHPRYQCRNHAEYISKYALPPYSENS